MRTADMLVTGALLVFAILVTVTRPWLCHRAHHPSYREAPDEEFTLETYQPCTRCHNQKDRAEEWNSTWDKRARMILQEMTFIVQSLKETIYMNLLLLSHLELISTLRRHKERKLRQQCPSCTPFLPGSCSLARNIDEFDHPDFPLEDLPLEKSLQSSARNMAVSTGRHNATCNTDGTSSLILAAVHLKCKRKFREEMNNVDEMKQCAFSDSMLNLANASHVSGDFSQFFDIQCGKNKTRNWKVLIVYVCLIVAVLHNLEYWEILSFLKSVSSGPSLKPFFKTSMTSWIPAILKMDTNSKETPSKFLSWNSSLRNIKPFTKVENSVAKLDDADSVFGLDLGNSMGGRKTKENSASWSWWASNCLPPTSPEYTVYPLSFLPTVGTSAQDTMSYEGSRLASLNALPASCNVSRLRLAQTGFYYDNSDCSGVVCYSCGARYSQWKDGDNPGEIHRTLSPNCPHLLQFDHTTVKGDPSVLSNHRSSYLILPSPSSGSSSMDFSGPTSSGSSGYGSMCNDTSVKSSLVASTISLINEEPDSVLTVAEHREVWNAGNQYDSSDLETDCSAILPSSLPANPPSSARPTKPVVDSQRSFLSNQSEFLKSHGVNQARVQMGERPMLAMDRAVYPQFARLLDRRATFVDWPLTKYFNPEDLIQQGFYYAGYADCIRCFYCGVGLKSWAENDNVMVEHIRWRPSCEYVLNIKGRQFVEKIRAQIEVKSNTVQNNQSNIGNQGFPNTSSQPNTSVTINQTAAAMSMNPTTNSASRASVSAVVADSVPAPVLATVQGMGFSMDSIARAVMALKESEVTQVDADTLADKLLDMDTNNETGSLAAANGCTPGLLDSKPEMDGPETSPSTTLLYNANEARARLLLSENKRLRAIQTCQICQKAKVGIIFLPCSHVVACASCGNKIKRCNKCDSYIKATANVYLS